MSDEHIQLVKDIFEAYYKQFPKGWIKVSKTNSINDDTFICFGVQQADKHSNGIKENDPAYHVLNFWALREGGIKLDASVGGRLYIKTTDPRYALGVVKTGFRAKTGDAAAILKHLTKYFTTLKNVVEENIPNLTKERDTLAF